MSITSELRLFAADPYTGWVPTDKQQAALRAMADRIDAEYESACAEAYGNGVESVALPDMTAYVKLPLDADGEPIHVGDVMEERSGHTFEVASIMVFGGSGNQLVFSDARNFSSFREPHDLRHHHAPTVEDVLREFADELWNSYCIGGTASDSGVRELEAKYVARLRLAEGEDA